MKLARRRFLKFTAGTAAACVASGLACAEAYPARPVHILVGFPPGGLTDIVARLIGQRLSEQFGQPFVVENRPGAVTNLATEEVVRAQPDGYALLLATSLNAINASVYDKLGFDFARDVAPVAAIVDAGFVMEVNPSVPAQTVADFIAYAKANPGKLKMASAGIGSPEHVAGAMFQMTTGVDLLHVPYRGSAPYLIDLVAGQVDVVFGPIAPSVPYVNTGKLRALAVTTATPAAALPDVPPMNRFLPGFALSSWQGLVAPKNTPASAIDALNAAVNAALSDPSLVARFAELGATPIGGSSADFAALINNDTAKWAKAVKFANIKAE